VVAAGDEGGELLEKAMFRPWIVVSTSLWNSQSGENMRAGSNCKLADSAVKDQSRLSRPGNAPWRLFPPTIPSQPCPFPLAPWVVVGLLLVTNPEVTEKCYVVSMELWNVDCLRLPSLNLL